MSQFSKLYEESLRVKDKKNSNQNKIDGAAIHKFGAIKTTIGDITFDSKIEASFYERLSIMLKCNLIKALELQPKYILQEAFVDRIGEKHRAIFYHSDFEVIFNDGTTKVYDTKGMKTKEYAIKKKLLLYRYPELIFEEVYSADSHPINSDILEKRGSPK